MALAFTTEPATPLDAFTTDLSPWSSAPSSNGSTPSWTLAPDTSAAAMNPQQQHQAAFTLPPGYVLVPISTFPQQPVAYSAAPTYAAHYGGVLGMGDGPKQLIINFLDPEVTNAELHTAFSAIGPLDAARVIYDKLTSRSKGFGFVYFKSSRDAAAAVQCMTGHPLRGRRIKVSFANPQRPMPTMDAAF